MRRMRDLNGRTEKNTFETIDLYIVSTYHFYICAWLRYGRMMYINIKYNIKFHNDIA